MITTEAYRSKEIEWKFLHSHIALATTVPNAAHENQKCFQEKQNHQHDLCLFTTHDKHTEQSEDLIFLHHTEAVNVVNTLGLWYMMSMLAWPKSTKVLRSLCDGVMYGVIKNADV